MSLHCKLIRLLIGSAAAIDYETLDTQFPEHLNELR